MECCSHQVIRFRVFLTSLAREAVDKICHLFLEGSSLLQIEVCRLTALLYLCLTDAEVSFCFVFVTQTLLDFSTISALGMPWVSLFSNMRFVGAFLNQWKQQHRCTLFPPLTFEEDILVLQLTIIYIIFSFAQSIASLFALWNGRKKFLKLLVSYNQLYKSQILYICGCHLNSDIWEAGISTFG